MAAEKLSPRQKMISLMYLVLTAMLALQVSSNVLEKFIAINEELESDIEKRDCENGLIIHRIEKLIQETGKRKDDVAVLQKAHKVRAQSKSVLITLNDLRELLIEKTGGRNEKTGYPKTLKANSVVAKVMIDNKKAYQLQQTLNDYMQYLSKVSGKPYPPLALDANETILYKDNPNQAGKDFATLNFYKTPVSAALATLSMFANKVIHAETEVLEILARRLGAEDVKFDTLIPMVRPQSNIVAAGSRYKAELFLTASSSGMRPSMSINGKPIPVKEGFGKIDFAVPTNAKYDKNGRAKRSFKASIKLDLPGGKTSSFNQEVEYFVAKPVIQVQSAAVQALYLNCGNELNVQVPALGTEYNPTFTASGAKVISGQGKGLITLVPNAQEVTLKVFSNKALLGTTSFKVRKIPKPDLLITSGGKIVNEKMGFPAPGPRRLEVRVVPDESFKAFLPKDASYKVSQWEITLARGSRPIKQQKASSAKVNLHEFVSLAKPGDRLVIEIKSIKRRNFRGEVEQVNMGTIVHTIPLT